MTTPVFNAIAGVIFFHETFTMQMAIGATVVMVSLSVMVMEMGKGGYANAR
ncbi:MAG: hypothetical protein JW915_21725 [Chitinispirillaceae bacterium]|nr:hypothetical protein [Chitinispirillaceae bacterium]